MKNKLKDMLEEGLEKEDIFYTLTDEAVAFEIDNGFEELTEQDKKAFFIGKYLMEVNNGGFDQYFLNTQGVYARDTVDFLDAIGDKSFSNLMDEAISIHRAVIPNDQKLEEFSKIDDKFYYLSTKDFDDLYEKVVDYLKDYEEDR